VSVAGSAITGNGEHGILSLGAKSGRLDGNRIEGNEGYGVVLDPETRLEWGDNILELNVSGDVLDARAPHAGSDEEGGGAE
jgi:hypothetical protein